MAWRFEVISPPRFRLDLSRLGATVDLALSEVGKLPVWLGNEQAVLGDFCRITPASDGIERWSGQLEQLDGIGTGHRDGTIEIEGTTGHRIGCGMTGGALRVRGDVGDDLGNDLVGGTILVDGSCGDRAGSFSPGAARGMRGGTILIAGNAGREAGQRMRRGVLAIGGTAGAGAANQMIAGTLVAGELAGPFGLGLKRGSVICRQTPRHLPIWFGPAVGVQLSITRLLARYLSQLPFTERFSFLRQEFWQRSHGDRLARSQGELLFPGP